MAGEEYGLFFDAVGADRRADATRTTSMSRPSAPRRLPRSPAFAAECRKLAACRLKEPLLSAAGVSLLVATIAGAVGSHALPLADAQALRSFETAVHFQFFHGLGVIAITLFGLTGRAGNIRAAAGMAHARRNA